ncbi:hypothetical protein WME98_12870 [Sorangium sp. So ce296]|uniref:hypothetical protein n=1 Tax=Sorangium sp. So ce296 TaxID=3133296 RepID=UPI003F619A48
MKMADGELDNLVGPRFERGSNCTGKADVPRRGVPQKAFRNLGELPEPAAEYAEDMEPAEPPSSRSSRLVSTRGSLLESADLGACSIMERSLHVGAAEVSLCAYRCAASWEGARSTDPLAFGEMTQDDQDVESHLVVVREISPFGIELIVIADIYSCFLCGA